MNGHTDDVGTDEYNQKLSERRAQAVRDHLVKAGLAPEILSVTGHGKKRPLVPGTSEKARAKNRRVELGIVNTRILYGSVVILVSGGTVLTVRGRNVFVAPTPEVDEAIDDFERASSAVLGGPAPTWRLDGR